MQGKFALAPAKDATGFGMDGSTFPRRSFLIDQPVGAVTTFGPASYCVLAAATESVPVKLKKAGLRRLDAAKKRTLTQTMQPAGAKASTRTLKLVGTAPHH